MKSARAVGGIATIAEKFWSKMKIAPITGGVQPAEPTMPSVPIARRIKVGIVSIANKPTSKRKVARITGTVPITRRIIRPPMNRTASTVGIVRSAMNGIRRLMKSVPAIGGTAGKRGVEKHMTWRNGSVVSIGGIVSTTHGMP